MPASSPSPQREVRAQSAAQHAAISVPVIAPDTTAAQALRLLQTRTFESVDDLAVCEDGRLVGLLPIASLLPAPPHALARDIMDPDPPVVAPGIDQEIAAWKAVQHGESSLAVVDSDGRFIGLIPPQRLLAILLTEHEEDMTRLGGYLRDTQAARTASQEAVIRRFWHRLPWLLVGLAGSILAATVVDGFEGHLRENVVLAFFMPGVVYLADAVGTQTETLIIRGLSVGVGVRQVVWREVITGLMVGAALALAFFPIGLLLWGQADVVFAVSLALLAASSAATSVAMALPYLIHRAGGDPAFGSGPLATVVQDILSILVYLGIASAIVS